MIVTGHWNKCIERAKSHLEENRSDWLSLRKTEGGTDYFLEEYPEDVRGIRWIREGVRDDLQEGLDAALAEFENGARASLEGGAGRIFRLEIKPCDEAGQSSEPVGSAELPAGVPG